MAELCSGRRDDWGGYTFGGLVQVSDRLRDTPNPSLGLLERLEHLEDEIAARCRDVPAPIEPPSLTVAAHQIVWLDEADFYGAHGDAHLYADDHYQNDDVLDWVRDRYDRDAVRLASEASREILHAYICRVTGVAPEILHVQGGVATLDDGRGVLEARLPPWADPLGRGRDHEAVAREIEASTYAEFSHWLRRFDDGAIVGWMGKRYDCVMHRYFRQKTGVRWDCLRIDLDTATVESGTTSATVTVRLPAFAAFVSRVTTCDVGDTLATDAPITGGWLRRQLSEVWHAP